MAAQLVDVDHRLAEIHAQVGHMTDLVHHSRHVEQRLGGNTANVQAHAAQGGVALHHNDLESQVGCAKRCRITAGAATQHHQVAVQIGRAAKAGSGKSRNS